jgi:hypothetical protein
LGERYAESLPVLSPGPMGLIMGVVIEFLSDRQFGIERRGHALCSCRDLADTSPLNQFLIAYGAMRTRCPPAARTAEPHIRGEWW